MRDHRKVFCRAPGAWFLFWPSSSGGPGLPGASGLILTHLSREGGTFSYSSYTKFEDIIPVKLLLGWCYCDFYPHRVTKASGHFPLKALYTLGSVYMFNFLAFSIGSFYFLSSYCRRLDLSQEVGNEDVLLKILNAKHLDPVNMSHLMLEGILLSN